MEKRDYYDLVDYAFSKLWRVILIIYAIKVLVWMLTAVFASVSAISTVSTLLK